MYLLRKSRLCFTDGDAVMERYVSLSAAKEIFIYGSELPVRSIRDRCLLYLLKNLYRREPECGEIGKVQLITLNSSVTAHKACIGVFAVKLHDGIKDAVGIAVEESDSEAVLAA